MAVQQSAKDVYNEVEGDYDRFHQIMVERGYTDMQCLSLHQSLRKEEGRLEPSTPLILGTETRVVDIGSEPVKRTIFVVLEMELTEDEDTYQTADLAVELLNQNLDNDIKLVTATDKVNG